MFWGVSGGFLGPSALGLFLVLGLFFEEVIFLGLSSRT
jgi:hypothetical protein